jgi:hypothetical protein
MFELAISNEPWILAICGNETFDREEFVDALREFWDQAQVAARQEDAINTFKLTRKV